MILREEHADGRERVTTDEILHKLVKLRTSFGCNLHRLRSATVQPRISVVNGERQ